MKTLILLFTIIFIPEISFPQTFFEKETTGAIVQNFNFNHIMAWGDYDNDNDQDVMINGLNDQCSTCYMPIIFLRNEGNGNFIRIYDNPIAQTFITGSGMAWGDYDNDGWLDLFICATLNARNRLFHNDGNGNFTEILTGVIVTEMNSSQSCNWVDYNKDGWLDLYVTNRYGIYSNRLYKNNGDGTFTKILSGSIVNDIGESRGSTWGDYDNDGWPDLFVVNFGGQNDFLYHNNGNGTFTRIFNLPMVNYAAWGSSCHWVDFDNNGWIDLFVTNNNSANRLYYNHGDGNFTLSNSLLSRKVNGLGFTWGDYDNDGLTDLFLCDWYGTNTLYKNQGGSMFVRVSNEIPSQEGLHSSTAAFTDIDLDGKLDLLVANRLDNPFNYQYNNIGNTGNYLTIQLKGHASNKNGVGAKIKIVIGNTPQYKELLLGSNGHNSGSTLWPHFGIGNNQGVDSIIVNWPSGAVTRSGYVNGNRIVIIDEDFGVIGINEENITAVQYNLYQNFPNPFNPSTKIKFEIAKNSFTELSIYDVNGRKIETLVNEFKRPGSYEIEFNSNNSVRNLSSGIYFYKLSAGDYVSTQKMILIK